MLNMVVAKKSSRIGYEWRITDNPLSKEVVTGFYIPVCETLQNGSDLKRNILASAINKIDTLVKQLNWRFDTLSYDNVKKSSIYKLLDKEAKEHVQTIIDDYPFIHEW